MPLTAVSFKKSWGLCPFRGHVGPDDNIQGTHTDIRPREEMEAWLKKDPICRLERQILDNKLITRQELHTIKQEAEVEVTEAHRFAKNSPYPDTEEQAAQHSQALHALFAHIPGLKVVMPATPYDAKGLMISAIKDENPVVYIDDRWLYSMEGEVPEESYSVPIGKGMVRKRGGDVTLVTSSFMAVESLKAAEYLEREGIEIEVIDLRSIKPIDELIVFESVARTGRLVIADGAWRTCGVAAEIAALVTENIFDKLKAPIRRVTLPDAPAPSSSALEKVYYPGVSQIVQAVQEVLSKKETRECTKFVL